MKLILLSFTLCLLGVTKSSIHLVDSGYVRFEYLADNNKPKYEILIYSKDYKDTTADNIFIRKFSISNLQFSRIISIVSKDSDYKKFEFIDYPLSITIATNRINKSQLYLNKLDIRNKFLLMFRDLKNNRNSAEIKEAINLMLYEMDIKKI